jgi:hypothetical protein
MKGGLEPLELWREEVVPALRDDGGNAQPLELLEERIEKRPGSREDYQLAPGAFPFRLDIGGDAARLIRRS